MLIAAYATETVAGLTDSQCTAAFLFLAFGFWESTDAAAVFVFFCAAVFLTPPLEVLEGKVCEL